MALNILLSHAPKQVSSNLEEALNSMCNTYPVWAHNVISMAKNRQKSCPMGITPVDGAKC